MTLAQPDKLHRPEYFVVGDRSFETHPGIDKNLRQIEHRLKRGHLLGVGSGIPHALVIALFSGSIPT
jgi:hypothetical protein